MSVDEIAVKLKHERQTHEFDVPSECTWDEFLGRVESLTSVPKDHQKILVKKRRVQLSPNARLCDANLYPPGKQWRVMVVGNKNTEPQRMKVKTRASSKLVNFSISPSLPPDVIEEKLEYLQREHDRIVEEVVSIEQRDPAKQWISTNDVDEMCRVVSLALTRVITLLDAFTRESVKGNEELYTKKRAILKSLLALADRLDGIRARL